MDDETRDRLADLERRLDGALDSIQDLVRHVGQLHANVRRQGEWAIEDPEQRARIVERMRSPEGVRPPEPSRPE